MPSRIESISAKMSQRRPIVLNTANGIAAEPNRQKCRVWNNHCHVTTLPMATPDAIHPTAIVAKGYTLQRKCLKKWIGNAFLGTRRYPVQLLTSTPTLSATMHNVSDRQTSDRTDRQTDRRKTDRQTDTEDSTMPIADSTVRLKWYRLITIAGIISAGVNESHLH